MGTMRKYGIVTLNEVNKIGVFLNAEETYLKSSEIAKIYIHQQDNLDQAEVQLTNAINMFSSQLYDKSNISNNNMSIANNGSSSFSGHMNNNNNNTSNEQMKIYLADSLRLRGIVNFHRDKILESMSDFTDAV